MNLQSRSEPRSITTILLTCLALALPGAVLAQEALEGQAIHEMEVIDDSQFRLEVEKTELDFHPRTQELDEGATDIEELLFRFTPEESFNPYLYDSETIECPLVPGHSYGAISVGQLPAGFGRLKRFPKLSRCR